MTIKEALRGVNSYPIPEKTLNTIAQKHAIDLDEEATIDIIKSQAYNLAYSDLLLWLSLAPNISQGGQSYSFSEDQRIQFRIQAKEISDLYETPRKTIYGYKGSRL